MLELARERLVKGSKFLSSEIQGLEIVERMFSMLEVVEAQKEGRLVEAFVSGTAVSPAHLAFAQRRELTPSSILSPLSRQ